MPDECKKYFLEELAAEIKRLERYKKARASMESEKMKLEALRQHVPLTPQFDHLLRYEASLERNFDRTLAQLEPFSGCAWGSQFCPNSKYIILCPEGERERKGFGGIEPRLPLISSCRGFFAL